MKPELYGGVLVMEKGHEGDVCGMGQDIAGEGLTYSAATAGSLLVGCGIHCGGV